MEADYVLSDKVEVGRPVLFVEFAVVSVNIIAKPCDIV